jgi:hypothetical protein
MNPITVLLADDHDVVRKGMKMPRNMIVMGHFIGGSAVTQKRMF